MRNGTNTGDNQIGDNMTIINESITIVSTKMVIFWNTKKIHFTTKNLRDYDDSIKHG